MIIHTVRKGDSVYSIAKEYGTTPSRIITDNLLDAPAKLAVGEDIIILYPTVTHTVKGGETLASIAETYNTNADTLYRNNPILAGIPTVYPGQILNISYPMPPLGEIVTNAYVYPFVDKAVLRRTLPYLTYLSIFSYGISSDGTLISPEADESEILSIAREYGVKPVMTVTSLSDSGTFSPELAARVLNTEALADAVMSNIVQTVKEKNYSGVDIDFEYLPVESSDNYADFLDELEEKLPDDTKLFVSLAPKNSADQPGLLYEAHDYPLLAEEADYAFIMTYEWGYTYGPPMPVAPINEVRRVLDYAVSEISREKILYGIPNYGYNWALPYKRSESKAESLGNREAVDLAIMKNAAIKYDKTAESPYYTYFDRPETYSDAVEHIVWFENARSINEKLNLAAEYRLSGVGIWNSMTYFPALWTILNQKYTIKKLR